MSEYILYGSKGTGSATTEATLQLLDIPYRLVEGDYDDEEAQERVSQYNPMRQLPTLVLPSGKIMTESAAIMIWLTDMNPDAKLAPAIDSPQRADFLRWMVYIPAAIYSMYWVRDVPSRLTNGEDAEAVLLKRTAERIAECWRFMDQQITLGQYILGDEMSVLDIYVAIVSRWTPRRERFYKEAPKMAEIVKRVDADPRLKQFWADQFPARAA